MRENILQYQELGGSLGQNWFNDSAVLTQDAKALAPITDSNTWNSNDSQNLYLFEFFLFLSSILSILYPINFLPSTPTAFWSLYL